MKKPDFKKIANLLEMDFDTSTYPDGSLKNRDENVNLIAEALEQMYEQGKKDGYPVTNSAIDSLKKRAKAEVFDDIEKTILKLIEKLETRQMLDGKFIVISKEELTQKIKEANK